MSVKTALKALTIFFSVLILGAAGVLPICPAAAAASSTPDPTLDSDGDGYADTVEIDWGYDPLSTSTVRQEQKIEINLAKQRLSYLVGGEVRKEFSVSTGRSGWATPKGSFKIANKSLKAWSAAYGLWMPYWLGLSGAGIRTGSIGIHELPIWPSGYREGESHLGQAVSHGCVRLGLDAAKYVYEHAPAGTVVVVK